MTRLVIPNSVSIHNARAFLCNNKPFDDPCDPAVLEFRSDWAHMEPLPLALTAAWGAWNRRHGRAIKVLNIGRHADYSSRMKLFLHLGVDYMPNVKEHEESGRFLPIVQVKERGRISEVIGDISALLHLQDDSDSLAAVQYCISELIRNALEHSSSPDGAFVCAHRFTKRPPHRVTIAVADCGIGIAGHLGRAYPAVRKNDVEALRLALIPGITGAKAGLYGTADNAGAGLFFTRCIAKATGGYFLILSGSAAYRLRREKRPADNDLMIYTDAFDEPRYDRWELPTKWQGTAVTVEIGTDQISEFQVLFQWILKQMPKRVAAPGVKFT